LADHFAVGNPVEEMIKRSPLAERTFKRRFTKATGITPIAYVQQLRIEDAKRRLECSDTSVDEISWQVGYEDAAFFRRFVQTHDRTAPGRLSQAVSDPGIRSPDGTQGRVEMIWGRTTQPPNSAPNQSLKTQLIANTIERRLDLHPDHSWFAFVNGLL
jgi:AraC-like DNA-binding protein